jgi:hypothetical protein
MTNYRSRKTATEYRADYRITFRRSWTIVFAVVITLVLAE